MIEDWKVIGDRQCELLNEKQKEIVDTIMELILNDIIASQHADGTFNTAYKLKESQDLEKHFYTIPSIKSKIH